MQNGNCLGDLLTGRASGARRNENGGPKAAVNIVPGPLEGRTRAGQALGVNLAPPSVERRPLATA